MLCLCVAAGSTVTGQGTIKRGKREGVERKSFTIRQGFQSSPDWTENNKVQQEELNQSLFFRAAELPASPFLKARALPERSRLPPPRRQTAVFHPSERGRQSSSTSSQHLEGLGTLGWFQFCFFAPGDSP